MKKIFQLFVLCFLAFQLNAFNHTENHLMVVDTSCDVTINYDSTATGAILIAEPTGTAPFAYLWNTGETTQTILINTWQFNYCVSVTDADGCVAETCLWPPSCSVYVQTSAIGGLSAVPNGTAPFTYLWSSGETTQNITPSDPGTYCVTLTTSDGCTASDCGWYGVPVDSCELEIVLDSTAAGNFGLVAVVTNGTGAMTYEWSTGETTPSIIPTTNGTYCVTVTNSGDCFAIDCFTYFNPANGSQIQGYVYRPDSLTNPAVQWEGYAELFEIEQSTGNYILVSTVDLESGPFGGFYHYYDFGDAPQGEYIVRVAVDPDDPIAGDYLPTYYGNVVEWDEATVISTPSNQAYFDITLDDGMMLTGDGGINGLVLEGDGLKPNEDPGRNPGDPMSGVSILLFDEFGNAITHTLTDVNGEYSFGDLPFGTYQVVVEIVGIEQGIRWVTLSADEPIASGTNFEVNENEIVNGVAEWVAENGFHIYPNPATSHLTLSIESSANFEAELQLATLTGATILAQPKNIVKGTQTFNLDLDQLPSGIYFLQLTTGNEVISRRVVKQ